MLTNPQRFAAALSVVFLLGGAAGFLVGHSGSESGAAGEGKAFVASGPSRAPYGSENLGASERDAAETNSTVPLTAENIARPMLAAVRARDFFRRRHDIYAFGQTLDRDTIRLAMEATLHFSESDREQVRYPLVARWLELDPEAAYAWVSALPKPGERASSMREFFHSLGLKDPATALTFLTKYQGDPKRGEDFTYSVLEAWSVQDPAGAVDAAMSLQKKGIRDSATNVAIGRWAKRDPQGALARVAQFTDPQLRQSSIASVLHEWAEEDPQSAANHALSLPAGKERTDALASVIAGGASADSELAMNLLAQMPPGPARTETVSRVVREIDDKDVRTAAEFVLALPASDQRNSVYQVASLLARQDRAFAIEWAGRLTGEDARVSAMQRIVREWASDDPKSAAQYCAGNALTTPELLGEVVGRWAQDDPRSALAWAGTLPVGAERENALYRSITAIGGSDPGQAANLATTMLSGEKQTQAFGGIATNWATRDPKAAAAWAGQIGDTSARQAAMAGVVSQWAQQDPAAAAAWTMGSPEGAGAVFRVSATWANQDPTAAAKWLDTLAAGTARDTAVSAFSQTVSRADPEGAAAWASTISLPTQRAFAMERIYESWRRTDPKSAAAWMSASPAVSEELKRRVLQSSD